MKFAKLKFAKPAPDEIWRPMYYLEFKKYILASIRASCRSRSIGFPSRTPLQPDTQCPAPCLYGQQAKVLEAFDATLVTS